MYSPGNPAIPQRIAPIPGRTAPIPQRIFAARHALAPPRPLPCVDARKPPVIRGFGAVCSDLSLPLKRRSG